MRLKKYISFLISLGFKFYIKWTLPTYSSLKKKNNNKLYNQI